MGCCIAASPLAPPAVRDHCRQRGSGGETRQLRGGPVVTDRPLAGPGPAGVGARGDPRHVHAASPTPPPRPRLGPGGPRAGARLPRPRDQDGQDGRLRPPLTFAGPDRGTGEGARRVAAPTGRHDPPGAPPRVTTREGRPCELSILPEP